MDKEIIKLESCLKAMKKCLKIQKVESCICFSDAFKVLNAEVKSLSERIDQLHDAESEEKLISLNKEIWEIQKIITKGDKECLGCNPCMASVVFKAYSDTLNRLYENNSL